MPKASSAIEKALAIAETLAGERQPVALARLAEITGLPKQTVHRALQQLEEAKAVQRSHRSDGYILGQRMRMLAFSTIRSAAGTLPVRAVLETLANEVGESANLGVLSGRKVRYIERVEYAWPLRFTISPDDELPAHAVAIGKLLLANLPEPERSRLLAAARFERCTERTITDPAALARELDRIVRDGHSRNDQEYHSGLVGVGVPVLDRRGDVIAGLAIHGVIPRTSLDRLAEHLPRMRKAAAAIADLLEAAYASAEPDASLAAVR
ncbi:IclR family transcriptional regulator [soil metagenome]